MKGANSARGSAYPYFILQVWGGRLPTPPEYRGTAIGRQFQSGRIGGKRIIREERFVDDPEGRAALTDAYQGVDAAYEREVFWVRAQNQPRTRIGSAALFRADFVEQGITTS